MIPFNQKNILDEASPGQKILWNSLFNQFGDNISITQYVYSGTMNTTELNVYSARKLYFAYQLDIFTFSSEWNAVEWMALHDASNNVKAYATNNAAMWNTVTSIKIYAPNTIQLLNQTFSRLTTNGGYNMINFIGYRIGI